MVSTVIVHVIGFSALLAVLATVMGYVSFTTYNLIKENEEENLAKIADSVSLQLRYLLKVNTNFSITLRYPLEAIYNRQYNILIGSGKAIMDEYGFISGLDNDTLYVVVVDLSNNRYASSAVAKNSTYLPLILSENPKIFGSTTITVVEKKIYSDHIELNIVIRGVRVG